MAAPQSSPKPSSDSPLPPLETADPLVNRDTNSSGSFSQGPVGGAAAVAAVGGGGEMDTTALKYFIEQKFPEALLMEEHQVCLYDWRARCAFLWLNDFITGMFYSILLLWCTLIVEGNSENLNCSHSLAKNHLF